MLKNSVNIYNKTMKEQIFEFFEKSKYYDTTTDVHTDYRYIFEYFQ